MKITCLVLACAVAGGCTKMGMADAEPEEDAWPVAFTAWMPVGADRAW